jgi:MFS family permease
MLILSPVAGRILDGWGAPRCLTASAAIMSAGYVAAALLHEHLVPLLVVTVLMSVGSGTAYAAMPRLIMDHVPTSTTSAAVGVNALMRSVGTTTASAVVVTVLLASATAGGGPTGTAVAASFLLTAGVLACGVLLSLLIPRHRDDRLCTDVTPTVKVAARP